MTFPLPALLNTHTPQLEISQQTSHKPNYRLAVPPTRTLEEREQLHLLRKRVDYEKGNPEHVDPVALKVFLCTCVCVAVCYGVGGLWVLL